MPCDMHEISWDIMRHLKLVRAKAIQGKLMSESIGIVIHVSFLSFETIQTCLMNTVPWCLAWGGPGAAFEHWAVGISPSAAGSFSGWQWTNRSDMAGTHLRWLHSSHRLSGPLWFWTMGRRCQYQVHPRNVVQPTSRACHVRSARPQRSGRGRSGTDHLDIALNAETFWETRRDSLNESYKSAFFYQFRTMNQPW